MLHYKYSGWSYGMYQSINVPTVVYLSVNIINNPKNKLINMKVFIVFAAVIALAVAAPADSDTVVLKQSADVEPTGYKFELVFFILYWWLHWKCSGSFTPIVLNQWISELTIIWVMQSDWSEIFPNHNCKPNFHTLQNCNAIATGNTSQFSENLLILPLCIWKNKTLIKLGIEHFLSFINLLTGRITLGSRNFPKWVSHLSLTTTIKIRSYLITLFIYKNVVSKQMK